MIRVTVLGLGAMGAALARQLLHSGHSVSVWNRTKARADALVDEGAVAATSVEAAVAASPFVVVCVDDYEATRLILEADSVAAALAGRTLIQLSTGSPRDAREAQAWLRARGAEYLDGAILATPSQMGRPDTTVFVAGSEAAFLRSEPVLRSLGGNLLHLGEAIGSASALDIAALSFLFGGMLGFLHGARVCEVEGLPVASLGAMVAALAPGVGEMIQRQAENIQSASFDNPESSVRICSQGFELFARHAREAGIDASFPRFGSALFARAIAAGHAEQAVGSVIQVLRAQS